MPRPSPFERRQSSSSENRKLSDNPATVRTREYERSQIGVQAAFRKADTAASVARSRARKALQESAGWGDMSAKEQASAIHAAETKINRKRDTKKKMYALKSIERGSGVGDVGDNYWKSWEWLENMDEDDEGTALEERLARLDENKREAAEDIMGFIGTNGGRLAACLEAIEAKGNYDESPCSTDLSFDEEEEDQDEWEDEEAEEDLEADEIDSENE